MIARDVAKKEVERRRKRGTVVKSQNQNHTPDHSAGKNKNSIRKRRKQRMKRTVLIVAAVFIAVAIGVVISWAGEKEEFTARDSHVQSANADPWVPIRVLSA